MRKDRWTEALSNPVYVRNRYPSSVLPSMTPYEALTGEKPSVGHLRQFGCPCFVHIPKEERTKLDPKAKKCVFLGSGSDRVKGYCVFDEQLGKTVISRDVQFDECNSRTQQQILEDDVMEENGEDSSTSKNVDGVNLVGNKDGVPVHTRKSQRQRKSPDRYSEWVTAAVEGKDCHKSYTEAMQHLHQSRWESAMKDEMHSMKQNDV